MEGCATDKFEKLFTELSLKVNSIEKELSTIKKENEKLKEENNLAFLIGLASLSQTKILVSDNREDNFKIVFLSRIALARMIGDENEEIDTKNWGLYHAHYELGNENLFYVTYGEVVDKSWIEISKIIHKLMSTSSKLNNEKNSERIK